MTKKLLIFFLFLCGLTLAKPAFADTIVPHSSSAWYDGFVGFASDVVTLNNPVQLKNPQQGFSLSNKPTFTLSIPIHNKDKIGQSVSNIWKTKQETIEAAVVAQNGTSYPATITKSSQGQFVLGIDTKSLPHGNFTLEVSARETSFYTRNITQDFSWGVIAVNTNKSIYMPHEKAQLAFGILDQHGSTICNAKITATITAPSGQTTTLSTTDKTIHVTSACGTRFYTTTPDYDALYPTADAGTYHMHIVADNHNGTHTIDDNFVVRDVVPFVVERSSFPTRIYPAVPYPVKLIITPQQNYSGTVTEYVPQAVYLENISDNGTAPENMDLSKVANTTDPEVLAQDAKAFEKYNGNVSKLVHELIPVTVKDTKGNIHTNYESPNYSNIDTSLMPITWTVDWKKGQTYTLSYTMNFPFISPGFYVLGPLKIGSPTKPIFEEARQWQIASDATMCWAGPAAGSWSGSSWVATTGTTLTTIASGDTATFDPTTTTCTGGVATNNNNSIDASFGGTVGGVNITSSYTGTITQAHSLSVGSANYTQAGGTFSGGSQAITITSTNSTVAFQLTGGTFTSTSGTFSDSGGFKISGGTFTHNSGTVAFGAGSGAAATINATVTLNNVDIGNALCDSGTVYTLASGSTVTVNSTLTLDTTCNINQLNGPGAIAANGNIAVNNNGLYGNAIITLGSSATRSFSGDGGTGNLYVPSIVINASGGTINLSNTFVVTQDWTYTAGTLNAGTSTVVFENSDVINHDSGSGTQTITGTQTLKNVTISNPCASGFTAVIASGTTLTTTGTLSLNANCADVTLNGPGSITAQGNITITTGGAKGNIVITANGTTDQTITGVAASYQAKIPSLVINKTSGTLHFVNNIAEVQNWTYTAGTLDFGTSTVYFEASYNGANNTQTITGSETFNSVLISNPCINSGMVTNIASGTTMTVAGTLTLDSSCSQPTVNGPGNIVSTGNIAITSDGVLGNIVITINGTTDQTITGGTSGALMIPSVVINKSSGTLHFVNNFAEVQNWTYTAGTLDFGTSTVSFQASRNGANNTQTITGSETFNNVTIANYCINSGAVTNIASGTTMTVTGTLTLDSSCSLPTVNGPGNIVAQGNITINANGAIGNVVITINGTAGQTLTGNTSGDEYIPSLVINKSSGTLHFVNNIAEVQNWTYTAGTLDFGTSTIIFTGSANANGNTQTITGSQSFYNVDVLNPCINPFTAQIASGTVMTVTGTLTLDSSCETPTFNGPGSVNAQGNVVYNNPVNGNVAITISGSNNQNITVSTTTIPTGTLTINKSGATASLTANATLDNLTMTAGTFDIAGHNLTITNGFTQNGGTIKAQGGETVSTGTKTWNGGTVQYTGSGTYTSFPFGNTYYSLNISGSGSFTPNGAVICNGGFTQGAGTFIAPSNMTIGGNFSHTGGTFTQGSGTITFVDNTQVTTISGSNTFYNMTAIIPGKEIDFTASSTTTVTNTLTLRGNSSSNIVLRSTSTGTQWNIIPQNSASVSYADIKDSNICSSPLAPVNASTSANSGNNNCWNFPGNAWYNSNWGFRMRIVINHTQVAGNLANFPVLISWASNASVASHAQTNGNDILFTDTGGTSKLAHEIEYYNSSTGQLVAWVNVPSLSSTLDTTLYMYYGNGSASNQQSKTTVWDSNYALVTHLGETSGTTVNDSTSNANNGTKNTSTRPNPVTGQVDGAQSFNSSNPDTIDFGNASSLFCPGAMTVEAWVNPSGGAGTTRYIMGDYNAGGSQSSFALRLDTNNKADFFWENPNGTTPQAISSTSISVGSWYFISGVWDGTTRSIYINGLQDGSTNNTAQTRASSGGHTELGAAGSFSGVNFGGTIDETKLSCTNRSASWIQTEYNNQSSPSTFITTYPITNPPSAQIQGGVTFHGGSKLKAN